MFRSNLFGERLFKLFLGFLFVSNSFVQAQDLKTPFEINGVNNSSTYEETIAFYKSLEAASSLVKVIEYKDATDVGKPLHLVVLTGSKIFNPVPLRQADTRFVMINNGIHAGEPCGIDASMMLARDLALDRMYSPILDHIAVLIIPAYNIGGMLNRGSFSRANQNGPAEYGFRGNGQNLDLNRDFIKADAKNARSFSKIFTEWRPDFFIDTHTTDGADYQYTLTYISTQKDKLNPELAQYVEEILNPEMNGKMKEANYEMCPYVQTLDWETPPDSGIVGFMDSPRYSSGYASLFGTMSFITEAHMLKSYEDRVYGTYHFCINLLKIVNRDRKAIGRLRKEALEALKKQTEFVLRWNLDENSSTPYSFKGFAASVGPSGVTGFPRISYDPTFPWTKEIPFYNHYVPSITVKKPIAYIIPQAWDDVIERLKLNGVDLKRLSEDVAIEVNSYRITDYAFARNPYEGHFPISNIKLKTESNTLQYLAGDYVVYTDQEENRYIVETLEPQGTDSYLTWNFFDPIFSRKEYFSPYLFEKTAQEMLNSDSKLKAEFQDKIKQDSMFAKSDWEQMDFLYQRSKYMEPSYLRYPVARLEKATKLPLEK